MLRRGFLFMAAPLPSGRWLVGSVVQEPGRFVPEAVGVVLIEGVRVDSARAVARLGEDDGFVAVLEVTPCPRLSPATSRATWTWTEWCYEERLFVTEGACTVWVGPDTVRVGRGDYCAIPLNTAHAIKAGPDGCRSLLISSPAGFAELITRAATPAHLARPDTQIDLELFAPVSAELGDQILGPPGTVPAGR